MNDLRTLPEPAGVAVITVTLTKDALAKAGACAEGLALEAGNHDPASPVGVLVLDMAMDVGLAMQRAAMASAMGWGRINVPPMAEVARNVVTLAEAETARSVRRVRQCR